jgi:hypothetical protein
MYISIINFPKGYSTKQWKKLVLKALLFTIIDGQLYKEGQNQILRWCLHDDNILVILQEIQKKVRGGHFSVNITTRKVLDTKY